MEDYLYKKNLVNPFQSAFRKNYNTTGLVLDITENIRNNMDKSYNSLLMILDLTLCNKLQKYFKFDSSACSLIKSFVTKKSQYVEFGGRRSSVLNTFRGISQGSILGPLLFILYMNDLYAKLGFVTAIRMLMIYNFWLVAYVLVYHIWKIGLMTTWTVLSNGVDGIIWV